MNYNNKYAGKFAAFTVKQEDKEPARNNNNNKNNSRRSREICVFPPKAKKNTNSRVLRSPTLPPLPSPLFPYSLLAPLTCTEILSEFFFKSSSSPPFGF